MWNLKYNTINLSIKEKQMHRYREHTSLPQARGDGGGIDWEFGVNRCELLYVGWINNKILLQHRELYPIPWIKHIEKNMRKNVYIFITECFVFIVLLLYTLHITIIACHLCDSILKRNIRDSLCPQKSPHKLDDA